MYTQTKHLHKQRTSTVKEEEKKKQSSIKEKIQMGFSESQLACKKHPDHRQLQGVCPFCLRERLSQLNFTSHTRTAMVAPSISSTSISTSGASLNHESPLNRRHHHRNVSDVLGSMSFRVSVGIGLKKSKSVAFVPRHLVGEVKNGKTKKGFWSKWLPLKGNKEVLMQSRSTVTRRLY